MGGIDANTGDLRQGYRLKGRGETPLAMMSVNSGLEAAE